MQKEIGERAWSVQVFTLPEHWTCPLRDSDENKLWTGEKTQLKQKKELNLLLLPPAQCLINIKKQTSLGQFKYNLKQTPMPLLFCKPLNWKVRPSYAEETLANQHDPRVSSKIQSLLFLSRVANNFSLVVQTRTHKRKKKIHFLSFSCIGSPPGPAQRSS